MSKIEIVAKLISKAFKTTTALNYEDNEILVYRTDGTGGFTLKYFPNMEWKMIKKIVENSIVDRECNICMEIITTATCNCGNCGNFFCIMCKKKMMGKPCPFCRKIAKGILSDSETINQYLS
jgi:hypothetical protein